MITFQTPTIRTHAMWIAAIAIASCLGLVSCSDDDGSVMGPSINLSQGLRGSYKFDGDANDSSPNSHDGTLLGGATVNGFLSVGSNDTDALSLPASLVDGLTDFSVAGWVKMETFHIWPSQWISGATAAEDNNFGIWYSPNEDHWSMCLFGTTYDFSTNSVFEDLEWHYIVVKRSGSTASLYIDGKVVTAAVTVSGDALDVDDGGFIVGQDQDTLGGGFATTNSLAGGVDDLRIYNRAINGDEVAELHRLGRSE